MFPTMKQTMHYENIFALRKLHPIVVGVLDKRDLSLFTMQLLLQLPVISSHNTT